MKSISSLSDSTHRSWHSLDQISENTGENPDDPHPEKDRSQDRNDPGHRFVRRERKDEQPDWRHDGSCHAHQQSSLGRCLAPVLSRFTLIHSVGRDESISNAQKGSGVSAFTDLLQNGVEEAAMTCPRPIPRKANPLCCNELSCTGTYRQ